MLALLAVPRLRLYFLSTLISSLGDYALWLAAGVWVKELTHSTSQSGLAILSMVIGSCFSPATGIVVDRYRRKPLLLGGNAIIGLVVLLLLFVHDARQVWLIYLVMFLYGVVGSLISSADTALLPQLAPEELLGAANGLSQALIQGLRLVTPTIGIGLLALYGGSALTVLDAATFGVGIICWSFIKVDEPEPLPQGTAWLGETTAGFAYLVKNPVLRQLTVAMAIAIFGVGFFETLGMAISTVGLHHSPSWVGVIVTSMGVTGTIGGLTVGLMTKRIGSGLLCALGLGLTSISSLVMAVPDDAAVVGASALIGLSLPWIIASAMTIMQQNTPSELMGRVVGADGFVVTIAQSIGIGAGAALISVFYYRTLCYFVAAVTLLSSIFLATRVEQRRQMKNDGGNGGEVAAVGGADSLVLGT
jgi:MFS family permease